MSHHLVLTHENADFDAVAAQLAAARLTPGAVPVLSRHVNRNVQEFLTLYGSALPFVHPDDLGRRRAEQVTVVDSQTYPSVRGIRPDTPVLIIDHHPLSRSLEPHQRYIGEPVGATTTLLVEQLCAGSVPITGIEATLLMLGIYEDTGSLLYGTTTARDILAAAWLLECGADLEIVRRFMVHVLSDDQRALYTMLLESAKAHQIHGFVVLIATASVPQVVEEISTLAHKIRDHFDSHATLLLVGMPEAVQLVARSTVDNIDVAQIAARFGGGGHGRAAAATIRAWPLHYVEAQLIEMLPDLVIPSAPVAEIMSWGAQTITANETVEAAAARMQRTGHEGYPVIDDGQIVGLLQRRDVDRAMSHGLSRRTVAQIMEGGNVSIRPTDSIERLQQVMMRSGWGQVPVVDDSGNVVGIVTRTDLIRRWGQRQALGTRRQEIQERMRQTLPPGLVTLFEAIAAQAERIGVAIYVVGGFVRDLLLGTTNLDIDFVVEGDAIALARALAACYGGDLRTHSQFGTAKWWPAAAATALNLSAEGWPAFVDFATARTEFYETPTALPTVEQRSIKLDLHRRDFTINTLAIRLSPPPFAELLDFYGGERDLRERRIRVLHSLSFVDDPTRVLRAVRFEQRLGFHIEARTESLIGDSLPFLRRLSGDRLRHEFDLILREAQPERALRRLAALGVLDAIDDALTVDEWIVRVFTEARAQLAAPDWPRADCEAAVVYWLLLACRLENPGALIERLKLSRRLTTQIAHTRRLYLALPELASAQPPSALARHLDGASEAVLVAAWSMATETLARAHILRYARHWRHIHPTLNGADLLAMGVQRGPLIGKLLSRLRSAWLDGEISDAAQEKAALIRWIADAQRAEGDLDDGHRTSPDDASA
jgi:tRNA nucleotidyltransferase (CCA-adding enzyme)